MYRILRAVRIRKGAEIVENSKGNNRVGLYKTGDIVTVYETLTDTDRRTWGRVSEPDPNGKANWFCIQELNGKYAEPVLPEPKPDSDLILRLARLEAWARTQGYIG